MQIHLKLLKIMKNSSFEKKIFNLTKYHYRKSNEYKKLIDFLNLENFKKDIDTIPYLPAKLFKEVDLKSISDKEVFKVLTSSGTSGGNPSKIFLDKNNAQNQTRVLNEIMSNLLGKTRIPMLIIDQKPNISDAKKFNAKTAAIIGFSMFGKNHSYLLNNDNNINYVSLNKFLNDFGKTKFFIFGFTSLVYEHLINNINIKKLKFNLNNGILLHGGGWKKMQKIKVSNKIFKEKLFKKFKFKKIVNYYGLIEQTGSIFIECEKCERFVTSRYSDVIIRDKNFDIVENGKRGYIQLLSLLPTSYPGHSILTEDIGEILINKKCSCAKHGKSFLVHGRAEKSEIRGCSDV